MKNQKNKNQKQQGKVESNLVSKPIVNVAPNKPLEKKEEDDTQVQKIADSIVIAFFLALAIKVGMWIWSTYFSAGDENEELL